MKNKLPIDFSIVTLRDITLRNPITKARCFEGMSQSSPLAEANIVRGIKLVSFFFWEFVFSHFWKK